MNPPFSQQGFTNQQDQQGFYSQGNDAGASGGYNAPPQPWGGQESFNANGQNQPAQTPWSQQPQQQQQSGGYSGTDSFSGGLDSISAIAGSPMFQGMAQRKMEEVENELKGKYASGASSFWNSLRYYFHVDNKYVVNKLKLLFLPFLNKNWERIRFGDEGTNQMRTSDFAPPKGDVNAPDLYLPVMAFVTYALCMGFIKGTKKNFSPEMLQDTFSTSALTLVLEVMLMRGGLYSLGGASVKIPYLDLCVYASYKYVPIALCLGLGYFLGTAVYNALMVYCALAISFFTYQSMQNAVPPPNRDASGHKRRMYFLVGCAALQILVMVFLGFTRDLGETRWLSSSTTGNNLDAQVFDGEADV
mmetsp:Transcript_5260/g.9893  ORF Transcript_5260/g.9893 Transcript_5260/m.9893 type:complete len:359 (-) Transcript_5260:189-1265(-)|eukprot:CAMPEP_0184527306 /NCGR_PEP_ID=MMETSP0198_2-20121128/11123_1 /TAXON_ID=1112570 /ORGANISM="Thraustochytrium sp., Strain LLF1b" /LENGTH=358 /DNA_ID=CAMNT_0026918947 /DNA_START=193 /DNA_END=1269 /DNA_ORIENTATION=-